MTRPIGLGLGLGLSGGEGSSSESFDVASLNWSLLHEASYGGSPWAGTASAGNSGSRSLTEATNPPAVGTAQNGLTPADLDGTNDRLGTGLVWSNLITATEFFISAIFRPDTTVPAVNYDNDAAIIGDVDGYCGLVITDEGFTIFCADTTVKRRTVAYTAGAYNRIQAKLTGGFLYIRKDGGAWSAGQAVTDIDSIASAVNVGRNFNATKFIDGRLLHLGVSATAFDDTTADSIDAANVTRYGL